MLQAILPQMTFYCWDAQFQLMTLLNFSCNSSCSSAFWQLCCHDNVLLCCSICFDLPQPTTLLPVSTQAHLSCDWWPSLCVCSHLSVPKLELGHCLVSLRADLSVGLALDMWQSWLPGHAGLLLMILASHLEDQDILSL